VRGQAPPRPDRVRRDWAALDGGFEFAFDDDDRGLGEGWAGGERALPLRINVPFPFQAPKSGLGVRDLHPIVWYRRRFEVPRAWRGRRVLLHFGAVDYAAQVWLNGVELGGHVGGHTPFCFDVTPHLRAGPNALVLRVVDEPRLDQPRGKQYWERDPVLIFYTATTGIWQPVWLEAVGDAWLDRLRLAADPDGRLDVRLSVAGDAAGARVRAELPGAGSAALDRDAGAWAATLRVVDPRPWSPADPQLHDLDLVVEDARGTELDRVRSYFGLRRVEVDGGRVLLNGAPLYQRLVLDQGYWPEGLLAPPDEDALRRDLELVRAFGFDGVRKHQKIEDPRWLAWADRMGMLVWAEMPSPAPHAPLTPDLAARFEAEWLEAVERDANHPSIVTWVPFNESWGIWRVARDPEAQAFVEHIVEATRRADPSRPVCDNSGYLHVTTDLADLHTYEQDPGRLRSLWAEFRARGFAFPPGLRSPAWDGELCFFVPGRRYAGQPLLVSEYGGVGYLPPGEPPPSGAFAQGRESTEEAWVARIAGLTLAIQELPEPVGYCLTQLTDVEQEINGLATYDRRPKTDPARIAASNARRG
jgi:beta-galactosidase/beta-glucuronidase